MHFKHIAKDNRISYEITYSIKMYLLKTYLIIIIAFKINVNNNTFSFN